MNISVETPHKIFKRLFLDFTFAFIFYPQNSLKITKSKKSRFYFSLSSFNTRMNREIAECREKGSGGVGDGVGLSKKKGDAVA